MTSKTNSKPTAKASDAPSPPASSSYSPSVPISLYREVAAELQSTKNNLDAVKLQNQELVHQNQQLRVEIERVVQSALQLRQTADSFKSTQQAPAPDLATSNVELHFDPPVAKFPADSTKAPGGELPPELKAPTRPAKQFTEQPAQLRRKVQPGQAGSETGGWWLVLAVLVIIVTAFGTGFLIVRPLLPTGK